MTPDLQTLIRYAVDAIPRIIATGASSAPFIQQAMEMAAKPGGPTEADWTELRLKEKVLRDELQQPEE